MDRGRPHNSAVPDRDIKDLNADDVSDAQVDKYDEDISASDLHYQFVISNGAD